MEFLDSLELKVDILPSISSQGGGSSFTGQEKRPSSDKVLYRYKQIEFSKPILDLLTDDRFRSLLSTSELEYLKKEYDAT